MNRLFSKGIWLLLIITISTLSAQEKSISLDDINEGVFRAEYLSALRSMNNGKEYSVYNYDRKSKTSTIDVYDYKTGDKVGTLLNSAKEHDTDSKTYEAASDGIGFNLGQITMAKIEAMLPDTTLDKAPAWSNLLQSRMSDYLNTIEVAFQIMSNKDTEFLKYVIIEYSGAKKIRWLNKDKKTNKYEPQNIFKKREMLIKKVQEIEPDYVAPKIEEAAKVPFYVYIIVFVAVFALAYATSS